MTLYCEFTIVFASYKEEQIQGKNNKRGDYKTIRVKGHKRERSLELQTTKSFGMSFRPFYVSVSMSEWLDGDKTNQPFSSLLESLSSSSRIVHVDVKCLDDDGDEKERIKAFVSLEDFSLHNT